MHSLLSERKITNSRCFYPGTVTLLFNASLRCTGNGKWLTHRQLLLFRMQRVTQPSEVLSVDTCWRHETCYTRHTVQPAAFVLLKYISSLTPQQQVNMWIPNMTVIFDIGSNYETRYGPGRGRGWGVSHLHPPPHRDFCKKKSKSSLEDFRHMRILVRQLFKH